MCLCMVTSLFFNHVVLLAGWWFVPMVASVELYRATRPAGARGGPVSEAQAASVRVDELRISGGLNVVSSPSLWYYCKSLTTRPSPLLKYLLASHTTSNIPLGALSPPSSSSSKADENENIIVDLFIFKSQF